MRKLVFLIALLITCGCEQEPIIFDGPFFVRFSEQAASAPESELEIIEIPVHYAGPTPESNIEVLYSVGGDAREGVDYRFVSEKGRAVIRRGTHSASVEIELINNANNILESSDIEFSIDNVSPDDIAIGQGDSQIGRTATFTILDECILSGSYTGTGASNASPISNLSVTSFDCREYQLSNWDINIEELGDFPRERTLTFTDNFDNTITIPEQEESTLDDELATIKGDGFINPNDDVITLNIELVDFEGSPTVTIRLIPNVR